MRKLKLKPVSRKSGEQSRYPLEQSRRCRWSPWSMQEKICEKGMFWAANEKEKVWRMVTMVMMKANWYDYEAVTNQEKRDEDMVDEMSQKVDSRGEEMRIEMSDLWFSRFSQLEIQVLNSQHRCQCHHSYFTIIICTCRPSNYWHCIITFINWLHNDDLGVNKMSVCWLNNKGRSDVH